MADRKEAMHEVEQASDNNKDAATLMNEWSTETIPSANCEVESKTAVDYKDAKVNIRIKNASKSMPYFNNLHKNG